MTTRAPLYDIEPSPPQRWRIGLFENSGAQTLEGEALDRLGGGITYESLPQITDPGGAVFDPCDTTRPDPEEGTELEWYSWGLIAGAKCSTLTGDRGRIEAQEAQAETLLATRSSFLGERAFWEGEIDGNTFAGLGWPNIGLSDASAIDLTPTDGEAGVVEAFGLLHEYLADTLQGLRGVIHVAPQTLPYLSFYGVVQRDGFTLGTTLGDHLVIAGSGYTGSGPGNTPQPNNRSYIYATSMVRVGQSPIAADSAYDHKNNKATAIAWRAQVAEWDLTAHATVRVCLTDPGPTCEAVGS